MKAFIGPFLLIISLAVTYFRIRMHTIIGAEAFHCPVRDGKEWDHLAMAAKLDWYRTDAILRGRNFWKKCWVLPEKPLWRD